MRRARGDTANIAIIHHDIKDPPPELRNMASFVMTECGVEVKVLSISEASSYLAGQSVCYGLFIFEGRHAKRLSLMAEHGCAVWRGIIEPPVVASIIAREVRRFPVEAALLMAYSHGSHVGFLRARLEEISGQLTSYGVGRVASTIFSKNGFLHVGGLRECCGKCIAMPLTLFKGKVWRTLCRAASKLNIGICGEPLLVSGWDIIGSWIVNDFKSLSL